MELERSYVHTAKDTPDIVEPARLVELAQALEDLITSFDQRL
jgi:hypothetical protein